MAVNEPIFQGNEWKYLKECVDTAWVSYNGKFVKQFEEEFAKYVGSKHAIALVNGTAAVHLALILMGIDTDDEVIVPSFTFVASINPILYQKAKPVFIDSELKTWNMDPEQIESMITEKTKAIEAVHIYGIPAQIEKIKKIADKYNLPLIEDASEGLGAEVMGKKVGTFGKVGAFSFNGNKLITCGGGGMLVTDDDEIADRARWLSTQARLGTDYIHGAVGYNYRMTNIQAAVGLAQLEQIYYFINIRRKNGLLYRELLEPIKGIDFTPERQNTETIHWMNAILIDKDRYGYSKDDIIQKLNAENIANRPFFVPTHSYEYLKNFRTSDKMDISFKLYNEGICLPSSVNLDKSTVEKIGKIIKELSKL